MKINYHKRMLEEIKQLEQANRRPKLLLHSCCAPCSTYVLQFLSKYFDMEIYFYNPNIHPEAEYLRRLEEQIHLVEAMNLPYQVIGPIHESQSFYKAVKGLEGLGEGSERCFQCFALRLDRAAEYGKRQDFDYFGSTLTISPLKNTSKLNEIGLFMEEKHGIKFLQSDFKKNNGYKTSVDLSKEYNLYRQDYCGCAFSIKEAKDRKKQKQQQNGDKSD